MQQLQLSVGEEHYRREDLAGLCSTEDPDRGVRRMANDTKTQATGPFDSLSAQVRGGLLFPGDEGYDKAREVWNGMIDRKPAVIVRCAGAADVIAGVNFAREQNTLLSIKGGGHNVTGNAVADGGLMLDMSPMKGIRVDPATKTVRAEAGLTWGEFDRETQAFGLAMTGGQVSSTGIAGLTLGGGVGWLMRSCGLVIDNLISADVVTADGRLVTASESENADLFWGLRGGGGNFGVVTSFEYRLHEIGPIVTAGMALYPMDRARDVLQFVRGFMADAPDELMSVIAFLTAPPAPFIPPQLQGKQLIALAVCCTGPLEEAAKILAPIQQLGEPAVNLIGPMPYLVVQTLFDEGTPFGRQVYLKSNHLTELSDGAIDTILRHAPGVTSPFSVVLVLPIGGAVGRVSADATAFSYRDAPFDYVIYTMWEDLQESERNIRWTRDFAAAMQPFSAGVYVNEIGNDGEDRVREAYKPETYERLVALKKKYDPNNLFRMNQNVRPTG
jgi:FAD/FMN-containing dehydrogenase